MRDIWAMYWKECKELFFQGNRQLFTILLLVVFLGGWLPYELGRAWLQLPLFVLLLLAVVPAVPVITFVAESFAGERERHTLESLLATRLSDASIVAGKIVTLLTLPVVVTIPILVVGFVAANLQTSVSAWNFYALDRLLLTVLLSLLCSLLIIAIGIFVSLRAATVRQAQQTLGIGVAVLGFAVTLLVQSQLARLPFAKLLQGLSEGKILAYTIGGVTLLDAVLIFLILMRFQRSRLIQG